MKLKERMNYTLKNMRRRCDNPQKDGYAQYGGRGIKVCERWQGRGGLARFIEDVGYPPGPWKKYSIDRIDSNGDYEPGNVKWSTLEEQHRNRRDNRWITIDGVTKIQSDWLRHFDVSHGMFYRRTVILGMSVEEALKTPRFKRRGRHRG